MLKRFFIASLLLSSALSLSVQSRTHNTNTNNKLDAPLQVSGGDIVPALKVRKDGGISVKSS
jgi:hypothetical protein